MNEIVKKDGGALAPRTLKEAMELSEFLATSDMVPKNMRGQPGSILIALDWAARTGMGMLQALQSIAVINGKPVIYGDTPLALVRSSGLLEYIKEECDGQKALCIVKRRGEQEIVSEFTLEEARRAGLTTKDSWKNYPKRMLKFRARGYALRDAFGDTLSGIGIKELLDDAEVVETVPTEDIPRYKIIGQKLLDAGLTTSEVRTLVATATGRDEKTLKGKFMETLTDEELSKIEEAIDAT
jgi:hypothetical protein